MESELLKVLLGVFVTGGFNAVVTVSVLRTNLRHFEKDIERHDQAINMAHRRIDTMSVGR